MRIFHVHQTSQKKSFWKTVFFNNPVLVQGVCLCPVIAAATSLKRAVVLSICLLAFFVPTSLLMIPIRKKVNRLLHPVFYYLFSSIILFLVAMLLNEWISTEVYASLYVFIPLMAGDSVLTIHSYHQDETKKQLFSRLLALICGFTWVICFIGTIREIITYKTIWDIPLGIRFDLPEAGVSFGAFILVAFLAAILQLIKRPDSTYSFDEDKEEEKEADNA